MSSQASSSKKKLDDPETHTCQRCRQPLILDPTISNLTPSSHSLITSALPSPSIPSALPLQSKLDALPPSARPGAEIWSHANPVGGPFGSGGGGGGVAESFILLTDSIAPPSDGTNTSGTGHGPLTGPALAQNLHNLLSSRTPISHPLCTECTTILQSELQKELEELSRERDAYIEFQRGIARNRESLSKPKPKGHAAKAKPNTVSQHADGDEDEDEEGLGMYDIEGTEEEWQTLTKKKKELEEEEEKLKKILEEKEKQLQAARDEEERVKREEEELDRHEEEFLLAHAAQSTELKSLSHALQSAKTRLLLSQSLLSHLESTNVYNDAFQIGHVPLDPSATARGSLMLGTINGLRLGGRPLVEWDEINAAWGLVALCIDRIAVKVGCVFSGYKIMPLGSFSRIEELPPNKGVYELYASSDLSPARLLQNRRFNYALVSLLDLLRQLVEYGQDKDRGWGVGNIEIRKDRISGHSIKLPGISAMQMPTLSSMSIMGLGGSSSSSSMNHAGGEKEKDDSSGEEQWTRACRAVLAVLKRILVVESEADRSILGQTVPVTAEREGSV